MTQQFINIGSVVNDGTGDTLREAFEKTNANFTELFGSTIGGTSLPTPNTVVRRDDVGGAQFQKILFRNEFASPLNFPTAADHPGMVAFANSTGKLYYSNGSLWLDAGSTLPKAELTSITPMLVPVLLSVCRDQVGLPMTPTLA